MQQAYKAQQAAVGARGYGHAPRVPVERHRAGRQASKLEYSVTLV